MKTLVLQLDHIEDAGSIRDKVSWGKASRVLLVWPVNYTPLKRKLDLVTIKRICASQGSRLGIVCDNPEVISEADALQIPVFDSVNRAMRKSWDRRRSKRENLRGTGREYKKFDIEGLRENKASTNKYLNIKPIFRFPIFLLAVASVFAVMIFLFPAARITLYPKGRLSEMQVEFQARDSGENASTPGLLSANTKTITLVGEATVPTTGFVQVPDKKAKGIITIRNYSQNAIDLPEGTIFLKPANPPTRYVSIAPIRIPAEETISGIQVEAVEPGPNGNTGANTIVRLEGTTGLQIDIYNPDPVEGGTNKDIQAVALDDINNAQNIIQEKLKNQTLSEISSDLLESEIFLPSSLRTSQIARVSVQPAEGQIGAIVRVEEEVEFLFFTITRQDLRNQADVILNANQPAIGWQSSEKRPANVEILSEQFDKENQIVLIDASISKVMLPPLDTISIRDEVIGKSIEDARKIISRSMLSDSPTEIQVSPRWLPFLPLLPGRIQMEVR